MDYDRHPSTEALQAFLDGGLPTDEAGRVDAHVSACARCTEELATWRSLFQDLAALPSHAPRDAFGERVMAGVRIRGLTDHVPLAARARARVGAVLASLTSPRSHGDEHLAGETLQDLLEGLLTARRGARAQRHLSSCTRCTAELQDWRELGRRLAGLQRFAPREGFTERVMAGVAIPRPAAAAARAARPATRRPAWQRAMAWAVRSTRRLVPRTRGAWAALSGVAVTPAAVAGLVLYTVFSHPTLTPGALASFGLWQIGDLVAATWSAGVGIAVQTAGLMGADALIATLLDAPLMIAAGVLTYSVVFAVAVRVLYQNLVRNRSLQGRYARVSAS